MSQPTREEKCQRRQIEYARRQTEATARLTGNEVIIPVGKPKPVEPHPNKI